MTPCGWVAACLLAAWPSGDEPKPAPSAGALGMSKAVAVLRVDGLEDYKELPSARLTSEDKLKVYFRPLRFKVEPAKDQFRARFTEDGRIRRKGEKAPIAREDKLLEHEAVFKSADYQIYLVNNIGLKDFPPGDYEFDIVLHDMVDGEATATQTLAFTIIPIPEAPPEASKAAEPAQPPAGSTGSKAEAAPRSKAKPKAKSKRPGSAGG